MSEVVDMCRKIRNNSRSFVLNPNNNWRNFDDRFIEIVNAEWQEFKFLDDSGQQINSAITSVPNDAGGIYMFILQPDIVPVVHKYILYIGRVQRSENQHIQKRLREYIKDTRPSIEEMRENWGEYLYIRYLPLDDNSLIRELEDALIEAIIPPFNDQYPGKLNQAMRNAF